MFTNNEPLGANELAKLELRAYHIAIPNKKATQKVPGLRTDSEHDHIIGFFLSDTDYNGEASTLDTRSTVSLAINGERIVTDVHACMFFVNRGVSLGDSAWKFRVPVSQSEIEMEYKDSGKFDAAAYPRTVTMYLVCEKKRR